MHGTRVYTQPATSAFTCRVGTSRVRPVLTARAASGPTIQLTAETKEGPVVNIDAESGIVLRSVLIAEDVDLYTTWGKVWQCGGSGQCGTCVVEASA